MHLRLIQPTKPLFTGSHCWIKGQPPCCSDTPRHQSRRTGESCFR